MNVFPKSTNTSKNGLGMEHFQSLNESEGGNYLSNVSIHKNNNDGYFALKNDDFKNTHSGIITEIEKPNDAPNPKNTSFNQDFNTYFFVGSLNVIALYVFWSLLFKNK